MFCVLLKERERVTHNFGCTVRWVICPFQSKSVFSPGYLSSILKLPTDSLRECRVLQIIMK